MAFGVLGLGRLFPLPKADSMHVEISFCNQGRADCAGLRCLSGRRACAELCARAHSLLSRAASQLASLAHNLAVALAADWFRLDGNPQSSGRSNPTSHTLPVVAALLQWSPLCSLLFACHGPLALSSPWLDYILGLRSL